MDFNELSNIIASKQNPSKPKTCPNVTTIKKPTPQPGLSPGNHQMAQLQIDIKAERTIQKITQRELATRANLSQATITRAECHGWVSIWAFFRIAEALGKKIILN